MIEQENELKSLLTEQPFEGIENTDLLLAQMEKPRDFDPFGQTGFAHLRPQYD